MTELSAPVPAVNGRPDLRPASASSPTPNLPTPPGRGSGLTLMGIAVLLGATALALGGWEFAQQHRDSTPSRSPVRVDVAAPLRRAVSLLASPDAGRFPLAQSVGRLVLVVDEQGHALLVVRNLGRAPVGMAYQAWVIPAGASPIPAARFAGGEQIVWLRRDVGHGTRVAVTLERAVGAVAPTRRLHLVARRP